MSSRNGDRARFQINRKRKLLRRQRVRALLNAPSKDRDGRAATVAPPAPTAQPKRGDVASAPTRHDV
jgi:hypothetical protein